jgi:hypothetical protein
MNIWMVFIPFILIYHMIQHRRVMEGRKVFIRNYLQSRKRALEESLISVERGGSPEIEKMLKEFSHSTTSFPTCDYVRDLIDQVLCPHYHRPRKDPNKEKRK